MEKSAIAEYGEMSLKREKEAIKQIVMARVNHEDETPALKELEEASVESNKALKEYIEQGGQDDFLLGYFGSALDFCIDYRDLETIRHKVETDYDMKDDAVYREHRMDFAYSYNKHLEIFDRIVWYCQNEAKPEEASLITDTFLKQRMGLIPVRNKLIGNNLNVEFNGDEIDDLFNRELLEGLIKMDVTHLFLTCERTIMMALFEAPNPDEVVDAAINTLAIDLSFYLDFTKKYNFSFRGEEGTLEELKEVIKKHLIGHPNLKEHPDVFSKIDHVIDHAQEIAEKYKNQNTK